MFDIYYLVRKIYSEKWLSVYLKYIQIISNLKIEFSKIKLTFTNRAKIIKIFLFYKYIINRTRLIAHGAQNIYILLFFFFLVSLGKTARYKSSTQKKRHTNLITVIDIALLSLIYTIISAYLLNRITRKAKEIVKDYQVSFMRNRSTID